MASAVQSSHRASFGSIRSYQRDPVLALDLADPVIDLARQQAQRKADHAAGMGAHALDRKVGLAGVGRAKHRLDTRGAVGLGLRGHREAKVAFAGCPRKGGQAHAPRRFPQISLRLT